MTALPQSPRLAHTRKAETGQSPPGGRPFLPSRTPGNRSDSGVKRGEQAKRSEEVRGGPAGAHTPGAAVPHTRGRPGGRTQGARPLLELCPHDFPSKRFKHESKCNEEPTTSPGSFGQRRRGRGVGGSGVGARTRACTCLGPASSGRWWGAAAASRCPEAGLPHAPSVRISEDKRKCCFS